MAVVPQADDELVLGEDGLPILTEADWKPGELEAMLAILDRTRPGGDEPVDDSDYLVLDDEADVLASAFGGKEASTPTTE